MARFTRTTVTNLRSEIDQVNAALLASGSDYYYSYQSRNGYHAVDLYFTDSFKRGHCVNCLDCNETPRKLIDRLNESFEWYLGRKH